MPRKPKAITREQAIDYVLTLHSAVMPNVKPEALTTLAHLVKTILTDKSLAVASVNLQGRDVTVLCALPEGVAIGGVPLAILFDPAWILNKPKEEDKPVHTGMYL